MAATDQPTPARKASGAKVSEGEPDARRPRGLPAIEQARLLRATRARFPRAKFWGYGGLILAITLILYWKYTQGENEHARQMLLAKQRSVKAELGPRWFPLRDKVERWTFDLAKEPGAEVVDKDALAGWDFRVKPGIYLRMRAKDVKDAESIRKGAKDSLKDAFTSCLVRVPNPNAIAGIACKHTHDCPSGEYCNETDHCSKAAQPFNLRVAYRTMHVLSDEWVTEVQEAGTDIRLRLFTTSFDDTLRDDMPLAAELLTRAQYYLVVRHAWTRRPRAQTLPVGGSAEAPQAAPHQARVCALWRLSDDKLILRLRREAGGQLIGGMPAVDEQVIAATKRQANSCALAMAVRQAMGDPDVPVVGRRRPIRPPSKRAESRDDASASFSARGRGRR